MSLPFSPGIVDKSIATFQQNGAPGFGLALVKTLSLLSLVSVIFPG